MITIGSNYGPQTPYTVGRDLINDMRCIHEDGIRFSEKLSSMSDQVYSFSRKLRASRNSPGSQALKAIQQNLDIIG